jgi:hypothetical protein
LQQLGCNDAGEGDAIQRSVIAFESSLMQFAVATGPSILPGPVRFSSIQIFLARRFS